MSFALVIPIFVKLMKSQVFLNFNQAKGQVKLLYLYAFPKFRLHNSFGILSTGHLL